MARAALIVGGALGVTGLGLALAKAASAKSPLTPHDVRPPGGKFDSPEAVETYLARALASEDPSTMDAAAAELDAAGFHDEARLLRTEAEGIRRDTQVVPVPPPSPPPQPGKGTDTPAKHAPPPNTYTPPYQPTKNYYTVSKPGESFWSIAVDFTGNGNRAPELMAVNKSKKPPPPATWLGERLELPRSWPATPRGGGCGSGARST